jgi:hypothetical protein
VGNKVALALLALAASIVVAACGGTQEAADLAGTSTPTTPIRQGRRHTDPHKSCDAQGVNATQLGIGACTENGVQYVVANYGGLVKLRSIAAAIIEVSVAPSEADRKGRRVLPQRDAFLRLKVQVQNRDKVPHSFGYGQTMLGIGASNYPESVEVERTIHAESLARAGTMQPGETLRGDVVFDITEADYRELQRRGRFFIWNFGQRAALRGTGGQLGQIRLYAGETEGAPQQSGR